MNPPSARPRPAGSSRWPVPRATVLAAVALVLVAITAATAATARGGSASRGGQSRGMSVSAGAVRTVDFQGVPGQLTIVGSVTRRVRLTGELDWTGRAPIVMTRLDGRARLLRLWYRCAAASPCTGNYLLVVPERTAVVVRQPGGHVVLRGLAGPLRITASSVDVSAAGLRSASLAAAITSGHLGAVFETPPRRVSVTLTSAQATLWLPASAAYCVGQRVVAGFVRVAVPQSSVSRRKVTVRVTSGELELLPRVPGTPPPG